MAKEIETHDHDLGLQADLQRLLSLPMTRRRALSIGGVGGVALLTGCNDDDNNVSTAIKNSSTSSSSSSSSSSSTTTSNGTTVISTDSCSVIPSETAGPYPADGSTASNQTLNVLTRSGIVRSDIRTSINTGTTAQGIPLKIVLKLVNTNNSCSALSGYAIYLWHCNRDGNYSLYGTGITNEDYLRGVQETDSNGQVTFTSIFPACYSGRWPHIHFEIYKSLATATTATNALKTSQLAMPASACNEVYATTGYSASVSNMKQVSLSTDNVFGDDSAKYQLSSVTGDTTNGYTATLVVGIAV